MFRWIRLFAVFLLLFQPLLIPSFGCSLFGDNEETNSLTEPFTGDGIAPADRTLCDAVQADSTQHFLDAGNSADFVQLENPEAVFLFTSAEAENPFDGQNVIELTYALVEFDYEDSSVDPGNLGGFFARWKMVIIPFEENLRQQLDDADTSSKFANILKTFLDRPTRTETQIPGPFLENGCEWGDTDEIGTQELIYSDYAIYDWDFFAAVDRVLGIVYEGDDGIHDDFIGWFDLPKNGGPLTLESAGLFRLEFESLSNVSVP